MTRDEARALLQNLFQRRGASRSDGLNEYGFGGAMIGSAEIYFQHEAENGALICRALVHKFNEELDSRIISAFEQTAKRGELDTGGGSLEYMPENLGIYLTRAYDARPTDAAFSEDMQRLATASLIWAHGGLERAAEHLPNVSST